MVDVLKLSAALGFELRQSTGLPYRICWPGGATRYATDAEIAMWHMLVEGTAPTPAKRAPRKRLGKTAGELRKERG